MIPLGFMALIFSRGTSKGKISEFPLTPSPVTNDHTAYNYQYTVDITVLESDIHPESPFPVIMIISIATGAGVSIFIIILVKKRAHKKDT